jgi:hypothetical protein
MELSDFQRRLLGFPAQAFGSVIADPNAPPEQQDMANARMDSLGQMGALLLAAGQRQSPQNRAAILARMANVDSPDALAMTAAQRRLMQMRGQQAQTEMQRQQMLRDQLNDPKTLQSLGISAEQAQYLGDEGIRKLLENQALANTPEAALDRRYKEAQISNLTRPDKPVLSPYEEATQKQRAEYDMRAQQADQMGLAGDERKEFLTTGRVTPGGGVKPPTKEQSDSYGFATRIVRDMPVLQDQTKIDAGSSGFNRAISNVPFGYGNQWAGKDYQQITQAQRDFINAVLRRESGAAISPQEFDNAALQYFPQPGDDPDTVSQKLANQRTQLEAIMYGMVPADRQRLQVELDAQKSRLPRGVRSIEEVR